MGLPHGRYNGEAKMAELVPRSKLARMLFNCGINLLPESYSYRNDEKGWLNNVGLVALTFRRRQKDIDKKMSASVLTMTAKRRRKRFIVSVGQFIYF
jgi:hypothetical protein